MYRYVITIIYIYVYFNVRECDNYRHPSLRREYHGLRAAGHAPFPVANYGQIRASSCVKYEETLRSLASFAPNCRLVHI